MTQIGGCARGFAKTTIFCTSNEAAAFSYLRGTSQAFIVICEICVEHVTLSPAVLFIFVPEVTKQLAKLYRPVFVL